MAKPRPPSDTPSDWAVEHTSMESDEGGRYTRGASSTHHTLGAYLLAPESDPKAHGERPSRRGTRPANLEVSANWTTAGAGYFVRPNEGPSHTPEHWEPQNGVDQGLLFQRPHQGQAKIEWMRSTKEASRRAGTGLGILQNEADRRGLGELSEGGDPDLSMHSAGLVEKMTGRQRSITNQMDFMDPEDIDRQDVVVPRAGEGSSFREPKTEYGDTRETKILSRGEANMGLARFRVALSESPAGQQRSAKIAARKRASQPTYTQGALFPEPGGSSTDDAQKNSDFRGKYGTERPTWRPPQ